MNKLLRIFNEIKILIHRNELYFSVTTQFMEINCNNYCSCRHYIKAYITKIKNVLLDRT